jgi:hypothetical protein
MYAITYVKFVVQYAVMSDLFGNKDLTATKDMDTKFIYKDRTTAKGLMWWVY